MLGRILSTALLAGGLAGLLIGVVHVLWLSPLIQAAEVYEVAAHAGHAHEHAEAGWAPAEGIERAGFTILADLLVGVGFALVFTGVAAVVERLRGRPVGLALALLLGLAGWLCFALAPAVGLPPELPGTPAGPLGARQLWWVASAIATAAGLACAWAGPSHPIRLLGIALILLPHAIGAPVAEHGESAVPAALARDFVLASLASSLLFWLALSALSGFFWRRGQEVPGTA
jgi:cobalt transporter subunit CbtA